MQSERAGVRRTRTAWGCSAVLGLVAVALALTTALWCRSAEHSAYHRSKAAEHERRAELVAMWPPGTPLSRVERDLGARLSTIEVRVDGAVTVLSLRPRLSLPDADTRDYPGFVLTFDAGRLHAIEPIGPDGHAPDVDLSDLLERYRPEDPNRE